MHGRQEIHTKLQVEHLKGRDQFRALGIDGRIILKWSLKIYDMRV
jgi:hypothetical protein